MPYCLFTGKYFGKKHWLPEYFKFRTDQTQAPLRPWQAAAPYRGSFVGGIALVVGRDWLDQVQN